VVVEIHQPGEDVIVDHRWSPCSEAVPKSALRARRSAARASRDSTAMDHPHLAALVDLVSAGDVTVLTGAGISTDSPTGSWTRQNASSEQVHRLR
jgi:hypothetical protein